MKTLKLDTVRPAKRLDSDQGCFPCELCGRATNGNDWIFILKGDDVACEEPDFSEPLVIHPVGPACAKRITKAGGLVTKWDEKFQDLM
jgi:hypothetical protein